MLYQIKDGTVSAGGQTILSHIDFYIKEKEKIAVVGKNGAGKTAGAATAEAMIWSRELPLQAVI